MAVVHHSAICTRDIETSLRFWRDALGFEPIMDQRFTGDWPTLLRARSDQLRAVFLGDPARPDAGIVELVDLGPVDAGAAPADPATSGFLLLSVFCDVDAVLERLATTGLGGEPRRIVVHGVPMATVVDPNGVVVELVGDAATANMAQMPRS